MITYGESKRLLNLAQHGIDLAALDHFFDGNLLTREDMRQPYGEWRFQSIGWHSGELLFVVWTPGNKDWPHVISARKAQKHERKAWASHFK